MFFWPVECCKLLYKNDAQHVSRYAWIVYLDDILIHAGIQSEHDEILCTVLT
jgi:hypothetical protein